MAHYKADVWLGSNSGLQTVEINSTSYSGVTEQICNIYNVTPDKIRNIREVSRISIESQNDIDHNGFLSFSGVVIFIWLFVFFTPYLIMTVFGAGAAFFTTKICSKNAKELLKLENNKLYSFIILISLISGGFGMVIGDKIQKDYFSDATINKQR